MWKYLPLSGILVLSLASVTAAADNVEICHRDPGNPNNVHIISVSPDDVAGHIAHGDHFAFGGSCYVVEPGDQNASTSEQFCQCMFGGHLASIHSQAEDDFISHLVDPNADRRITARIGGVEPLGFCSGPSATYHWTDGTAWDFANWRLTTGEPNCTGAPASIQFWPNTNGNLSGWNDTPAGDPLRNFVCKYQP
jgi:hypothetical protein